MTTRPHAHASKSSTTHAAPAADTAETPAATAAAAPSPPLSPLSPTTGIALVFIEPPPPDALIPAVPQGADAPGGQHYKSVVPKKTELAALSGAVKDLKRFTNFEQVFNVTGLPYAQVVQAFDVANQWSVMNNETVAWGTYVQTQEGICWGSVRTIMDKLTPVWNVATANDPTLAATFPSLAALFGAKKAIGQRSASTRRLNRAAVARGEAPIHGVVGKARLRRAEKAALASAKSGASPAASPPATAPAASPPSPTTPPNATPRS